MKKALFLTTPDARAGFSLAGTDQLTIEPHELEGFLIRASSDPDNGLVVIDERLTSGIDFERLREIERTWRGVMLSTEGNESMGRGEVKFRKLLIQSIERNHSK